MTIWEQLQLEPTSDVASIKRAYAGRLRELKRNGAADADIQALKEAFDLAKVHGKWIEKAQEEEVAVQISVEEPTAKPEIEELLQEAADRSITEPDVVPAQNLTFLQKLEELYTSSSCFYHSEYYHVLFENEREWSLSEYMTNRRITMQMLTQTKDTLPIEVVWTLIQGFDLQDLEVDVNQKDPDVLAFLDEREELLHLPCFNLQSVDAISPEQRGTYVVGRIALYRMCIAGKGEEFFEQASQLMGIYDKDPDVINMVMLQKIKFNMWRQKGFIGMLTDTREEFERLNALGANSRTSILLRTFTRAVLQRSLEREQVAIIFDQGPTYIEPVLLHIMNGYIAFCGGRFAESYWELSPYMEGSKQPNQQFIQECLAEDFKKMYSIFRKQARSNKPLRQHLDYVRKQAKQQGKQKVNWSFALPIIAISIFAGVAPSLFRGQTTSNVPDIPVPLPTVESPLEELEKLNPSIFELYEGNKETVEESFLDAFILNSGMAERMFFMEAHVEPSLQAFFRGKLVWDAEIETQAKEDFSFGTVVVDEVEYRVIMDAQGGDVLYILQLDQDEKVIHLYGSGWEEMEPALMEAVQLEIAK